MKTLTIVGFLVVCLCGVVAVGAATAAADGGDGASAPGSLDFGQCMETVMALDFNNPACFKKVLVKVLGIAVIAGSFTFKVPQIKKLMDAQDATGISFMATYVEVLCYGSVLVYHVLLGSPLSAYGENAIITMQQFVIVLLLWKYSGTSVAHMGCVAAGIAGVFAFEFTVPPQFQQYIFLATIPAFSAARIPQIIANFQNGHTGQLALITLLIGFAGSLVRVFTSLEEVDDPFVALSFVLGAVWNTILLLQVFYYWEATNQKLAAIQAKKAS